MVDPRLYIIMRTDLASMNPGKGMAQAAHAANAFTAAADARIRRERKESETVSSWASAYHKWFTSTGQFFGTTITLAAPDEKTLHDLVTLSVLEGLEAEVIHDPTYPVVDGEIVHLVPLDTCAYVFVPDAANPAHRINLPLHP